MSSSGSVSILDQVLSSYSHLNLTCDVLKKNSVPLGGGGYSDVFHAQLKPHWMGSQRSNSIIEDLLAETHNSLPGFPSGSIAVAIKRLRIWAHNDSKAAIEKVSDG